MVKNAQFHWWMSAIIACFWLILILIIEIVDHRNRFFTDIFKERIAIDQDTIRYYDKNIIVNPQISFNSYEELLSYIQDIAKNNKFAMKLRIDLLRSYNKQYQYKSAAYVVSWVIIIMIPMLSPFVK